MANVRKRGPNQWQAQVRAKGYPGQTRTFATRAAAEHWAKSLEVEMTRGTFVSRAEAERTTLYELLDRYCQDISPTKKGASSEVIRIRAMMRDPISQRFVATIRGTDIACYRDKRLKDVASATIRRELGILSHVFEVARKEWGIFVPNPVRDIAMPPNGKPRERRLIATLPDGTSEESRLIDACRRAHGKFLLPLVRLALETAMRRGEMLSLKWEYVDLTRRVARLVDTKNGDGRTVPLSTAAVEVLRGLGEAPSGTVFPEYSVEASKRAFARAAVRAGLDDFHFHDLRHEATTRMFERGLNVMEVASVTGHKDLRMLRRYTHLDAENLAKKLG